MTKSEKAKDKKLSKKEVRRIEKGVRAKIKDSRDGFLAVELEKYKSIKVIYD